MLSDVMKKFHLVKEFRQVGYFESEHHKQITNEIKFAIKLGKLIAITGIVGVGKTTMIKKIQDDLIKENEVRISKSLSVDKHRVTIPMLMMALFFDLSTEKEIKIPSQAEKRIRNLRELIRKTKKPVALFIDEAHDLHSKTLTSLKRLMEVIQDGGGTLSVVLAGHPKLKNELLKPTLEEIGSRSTLFSLDGITASKRAYIEWLLEESSKSGTKIESIFSADAIDALSDKLVTPLQIEHYLMLAIEQAYKIGVKPVSTDIIESVVANDINDIAPRLTRYGYDTKALSDVLNVKPAVIKSFFRGQLPPSQTQEIQNDMLAMGLPV
jgi:type II secretory pathway predicted ATPase ExeA